MEGRQPWSCAGKSDGDMTRRSRASHHGPEEGGSTLSLLPISISVMVIVPGLLLVLALIPGLSPGARSCRMWFVLRWVSVLEVGPGRELIMQQWHRRHLSLPH